MRTIGITCDACTADVSLRLTKRVVTRPNQAIIIRLVKADTLKLKVTIQRVFAPWAARLLLFTVTNVVVLIS